MNKEKYNERYVIKFCNECEEIKYHYKSSKKCCGCLLKRKSKNYCINCNKEISSRATRCNKCDHKRRKISKNICIDCKKTICRGASRCRRCDAISRKKPFNKCKAITGKSKPKAVKKENSENKLCNFGCGKIGKYQFKNGKWCCSEHYTQCPVSKEKYAKRMKGRQAWNKGLKNCFSEEK